MEESIEEATGSVLYDLDLPDAPELALKGALARHIRQVLKDRKLTQTKAAALTGIPQAEISLLTNYKLQGISVERMLKALTALGVDVQVVLRGHGGEEPGTSVMEPRAESVAYLPATRQFRLVLRNGTVLEFGRDALPELDAATDEQLVGGLGVSLSGGAITCRAIDMDISVEGLVLDLTMGKAWRLGLKQWYASQMGRAKSEAKASAARANGKKGGRPRRQAAEAAAGDDQAS